VPGWPEEADVGPLLDPGQLRQVQDERSLGRGLGRPVEVLEALQRREGGVTDPHPRTRGVAGEDLGLEQRLEKLLVGPGLVARPLGRLLEPLQDARRLRLGQQVGQPLAGLRLAHAHSSAYSRSSGGAIATGATNAGRGGAGGSGRMIGGGSQSPCS
jgi:hypothetical protein